jgi:2,6-dihydroxypseudooxynicotine hydrolase
MPLTTQRGFAYVTGTTDLDEGERRNRERLDLTGVLDQVKCPTYVLHGYHDVIFSLRQLELVRDGLTGPRAEIVVEPDGDHCCHNMGPIVRPRMADWMAGRLAG